MTEAIVAVYSDWGIGADGTQPVVVSGDRRRFRDITSGAAVILGRKTLADFPGGRPLKNRLNIVLSRSAVDIDGALVARSPGEALRLAADRRAIVIGGASVYSEFFPHLDRIYITKIDAKPHSDVFFPNLDLLPQWTVTEESEEMEENGLKYRFLTYERRRLGGEPDRAVDFLSRSPISSQEHLHILLRGSAENLRVGDTGLMFSDSVSGALLIAGTVPEEWLDGCANRDYVICDRREMAELAGKKYSLSEAMEFLQFVYPQRSAPGGWDGLDIRPAAPEDMDFVETHYKNVDRETLELIRARGDLFIAAAGGADIGFIGRHTEGSMGLLEILPEYRRRGFARRLECFLIDDCLRRGIKPFCQVVPDNAASIALQESLGLVTDGTLWFSFF